MSKNYCNTHKKISIAKLKFIKVKKINVTSNKIASIFFLKLYLILFLPHFSNEQGNVENKMNYIELIINGEGNIRIFYVNENDMNCQGTISTNNRAKYDLYN